MVNLEDNRTELLRKIKDEIVAGKNLPLYSERIKNGVYPVIGEGSHYAKIMFIGEAPGKNEAATGRPFCGASGRILDELLEAIGIPRKDVYATNIVKDRPPMNRDPFPDEIEAYAPYLDRQVEIIRPQVIATLGRFSMAYIINRLGLSSQLESISKMHGRIFEAKTSYGAVKVVPLYHPAVAVYNSNMKNELKKDFEILKQFK
ncbi:MAG: uracil-DNA glycosylase [Candidatus Taylorbacteria bacterium]|nr:uracil-DNA glycosylase [Candidatus Taylorbacteria bacterium]